MKMASWDASGTWLDDANFEESGVQKTPLGDLARAAGETQSD